MRLKNIIRNGFFSLLSQVLMIAVGFFSQRVMYLQLGKELVGMNSVISNIIAILSVSELGISTAVVYHLYHALAVKNESETAALMNLYRKAYIVFAAAVLAMGTGFLPFVHLFLKNSSYPLSYIRLIYAMWLIRTVLSYLLSYRRSILVADQKEYIVSIVTLCANILHYLSVIIIVGLTGNYELALGISIVFEAVSNIALSRYVDRRYPFLPKLRREPLPKKVIRTIFSDVKNIFVTRLSGKLLNSTDSLIISGFISVGTVGLFANYNLIVQSVLNLVFALSNAVQPSIGNLFMEDDQDKNYDVLRLLTFVFFFPAAFCACGVLCLIQPFIGDLWLNHKSLLGFAVPVCCAVNCLLFTLGQPLSVSMGVSGLFDKERNISLISAIVNLVVSLCLVRPFGIAGVLAGTGCSYLIQMVMRVFFFFRDFLKRSFFVYALELLEYLLLAAAELWAALKITAAVYGCGGFLRFLLAGVLCTAVSAGGSLLIFCRSERFARMADMLNNLKNGNKK